MKDIITDNCQLLYGDCLDRMKEIPNDTIGLTVTSPPYYNAREYSQYESYESYLNHLKDVFRLVMDKTIDGRMCVVNLSVVIEPRTSRNMESTRYPIPFHFVTLMTDLGWKFIEDIVWVKPEGSVPNRNGGFFRHRKPLAYKPNSVTEYIFVFQKPCNHLIDKMIKNIDDSNLVGDGYERTNVWYISPENKLSDKHTAPYPKVIPSNLIKYYSLVGDLVLDPYMGSNTTGIASIENDRRFVGVEIDDKYFELSVDRVNCAKKLMRLF